MRRLSTAILAIGIALVFVFYMITYTVDYNEIAIITTFDKAEEADPAKLAEGKDSGSVIVTPGLKWKAPWPIQRVQVYPTQLQVLQDTAEELQLKDGNTIIINMNLTWRISDPLAFFKSLGTIEEAEDKLKAQMSDLRSVISTNYGLADLVNTEKGKVRLDELEDRIADELRGQLTSIKPSYGVEVAGVTVGKMLYHSSTAESVNQRMTSQQEGRAENIRRDGTAQADAIVSQAEARSKTLMDFTEQVAARIERIGKQEAAVFLAKYTEDGGSEDLAIYLEQLEALEKILASRTTFVLDARTWNPLNVLIYGDGGNGNLSRLFGNKTSDAGGQNNLSLPAPLAPEEQAKLMREQIELLQAQIKEIRAELQSIENKPVPVRADGLQTNAGGSK